MGVVVARTASVEERAILGHVGGLESSGGSERAPVQAENAPGRAACDVAFSGPAPASRSRQRHALLAQRSRSPLPGSDRQASTRRSAASCRLRDSTDGSRSRASSISALRLAEAVDREDGLLAREERHLVVAGHPDRILRAGVDAVAAEDAAHHVDVEDDRVLLVGDLRMLAGDDRDALGRAGLCAHVAGDALERPVLAGLQDVLARGNRFE